MTSKPASAVGRSLAALGKLIYKPAARYPADPRAVFILALSVFSGLTALALQVAPQSLEASLPAWGVITWGVVLVLGSATALAGMPFQTINGIVAEQVGSVMVGVATTFYSTLALVVLGVDALQSISIILAWGLACFIRWAQLQALINTAYRAKIRSEILAEIHDESQ
jgi:hypothetical protein